MGVFIGVVVLLVCVGLVVLMMVTEWSAAPVAEPLAENPAPVPQAKAKSRRAAVKAPRKPAPKKTAPKKTAAKKKKK